MTQPDPDPEVDPDPERDDVEGNPSAVGVRRTMRRRHAVHRVSVVLRVLGWLAAAGCLLAGAAAAVAWAWQAISAAGS